MSEIKTEINRLVEEGTGHIFYLIIEEHTIADIARWIVSEDWHGDIMMFLNDQDKFL